MFGLFGGRQKQISNLAHDIDHIVHSYFCVMNEYQQYAFCNALYNLRDEYAADLHAIDEYSTHKYFELSKLMERKIRTAKKFNDRLSGIAREGGDAGLFAYSYLLLVTRLKGYFDNDADTIFRRIQAFEEHISAFQNSALNEASGAK